MTPSKRLAKRLKQARLELQLSQFQLGVNAGIDEATAKSRVSHYEISRSVPTLATLQQLAKALNKPLSWFFCEDDELELFSRLYLLSKEERHASLLSIEELLKKQLQKRL